MTTLSSNPLKGDFTCSHEAAIPVAGHEKHVADWCSSAHGSPLDPVDLRLASKDLAYKEYTWRVVGTSSASEGTRQLEYFQRNDEVTASPWVQGDDVARLAR